MTKTFDLDVDRPVVEAVQKVAEARGGPMAQVALAWVLSKPVVTAPIVGPWRAAAPRRASDRVDGSYADRLGAAIQTVRETD